MGGNGAQNKADCEHSSGRLVEGEEKEKQEGQLHDSKVDTDGPGAAVMESELKRNDQINSEVSCNREAVGDEPLRLRERFREKLLRRKNTVLSALKGWVHLEVKRLLKLALPIILTLALQQLQLFVSVLFVGHISGEALEIDAISLALSFINVSSLSIAIGIGTASDTLSSQAYGFKNYLRVGVILQRGLLILGLMMFPIWALWLNTESLFLLLHQPECVARMSSLYIKIYCLCLPGLFAYVAIQKYLQTQNVVWPFVLLMVVLNGINASLHAVFIYGAKLGFVGAAIALSAMNFISPVLLVVYIRWRRLHQVTWGGWSWEALQDWGQYLKLGIPGLLMTCLGWWSAEATTFVSGYISETEQAVNGVGFQILQILFMIPLGVSIATTIRVGNELGAGRPRTAKRAAYVSVGVGVCIALCYIVLLQSTKNHIGKLFTKDEKVIERVGLLMTVASAWQFTDGIQVTISGVFRGAGKQYLAAIINFLCYNVLGLSIGVPLALKAGLGTIGLWSGLATGNIIQAIVFVITLVRINWKKESEKAMKCARGSNREQQWPETEQDTEADDEIAESELPHESEDFLEMKEMDHGTSETRLSPEDNTQVSDKMLDNRSVDSLELQPESTSDVETLLPQHSAMSLGCSESCESSQTLKQCHLSWNSHLVLFLTRGGLFILGVIILIAGGVLSQQTPSLSHYGNSTDCHGDNNISLVS